MMGERTGRRRRYSTACTWICMSRLITCCARSTGLLTYWASAYICALSTARPVGRSVDPELMSRMLIISYCMGIRSELRLCEEVNVNLAYRWYCRLGLEGDVPDHSTFSKNRHGRFRHSDVLRQLFETTVARCIAEGLVGGEGFVFDDSLVRADVNRQNAVDQADGLPDPATSRSVREYLAVKDDAAFGGATPVPRKQLAVADPAARWTAARASAHSSPTPPTISSISRTQ